MSDVEFPEARLRRAGVGRAKMTAAMEQWSAANSEDRAALLQGVTQASDGDLRNGDVFGPGRISILPAPEPGADTEEPAEDETTGPDFLDLTAPVIKERVTGWSRDKLRALLEDEQAGKNRKGLTSWLEDQLK